MRPVCAPELNAGCVQGERHRGDPTPRRVHRHAHRPNRRRQNRVLVQRVLFGRQAESLGIVAGVCLSQSYGAVDNAAPVGKHSPAAVKILAQIASPFEISQVKVTERGLPR